jgi:carboxypeptidase C (cathepsin A)
MFAAFFLALAAAASTAVDAQGQNPMITHLPGAPEPLHFKQYSGLVPVFTAGPPEDHRQLHYWFVESSSPTKETDPLLLWLTGGPGCSGLLALLTENGPFNMNEDGETLALNPYSWNTRANVIYIESPAGVGYSLTDGKKTKYVTNDTQVAHDSYSFIRKFIELPEFKRFAKNDFYVAGESYAGHYVPELAKTILDGNAKGAQPHVNLKGTMSGNPCTNDDIDGQYYIPFLKDHALVSLPDFHEAEIACKGDFVHDKSPGCSAAKTKIFTAMTNRINPYNIYAKCVGKGAPSPGYCFTESAGLSSPMAKVFADQIAQLKARDVHDSDSEPGSQTVVPCMDFTPAHKYLNSRAVREALHIPAYMDKEDWYVCSQVLDYTDNEPNMIPIYDELVKHIRVLVYSGDVDSCVNYLGTETAVLQIKAAGGKKAWHAWLVDDQVAGFTMTLGTNLTFATVKDAGHMVPSKAIGKPQNALEMLTRFLAGEAP